MGRFPAIKFSRFCLALTTSLALSALIAAGPGKHKNQPPARVEESVAPVLLSMRVNALETLNDLHPTPQQFAGLRKLAQNAADKSDRDEAAPSMKYNQILQDLHVALVQGKDEEKINSLEDQLDQTADADKVDLDDVVDVTDEARKAAPEAVKLFTVSQIASLIAANEDDISDPSHIIKEALDKHHQSGDDWTATRDYAAEEIGILNGSDALEKVKDFLDKAHAIPDADFKSKRGGLIKEADKMFDADPVQQLRNWTENEIAHLLSNPQLPNAIDERSR